MSHRIALIFVAAMALAAALFTNATRYSTEPSSGGYDSPRFQPSVPTLPSQRHSSAPADTNFAELAQKAFDSLPRIETLRTSGESVHHAPKILLDSSEALTQVSMALRDHPEFADQGIEFYRACAHNDSLMTAVRAVCLQRLAFWTKGSELENGAHSQELRDLAQGLPPLPRH